MILIIHQDAKKLVRVKYKGKELKVEEIILCRVFLKLAEEYPDEIIAWCEKEFEGDLNLDYWNQVFHHDLIMASYALKTVYLTDAIGYIDQLPFVNVNREVQYATWRMSTDVGGIKGKVLLQFQKMFGQISDFGFLLNSVAKLGQQNGLFCYSVPNLIKPQLQQSFSEKELKAQAGNRELFFFVKAHYKNIRLWLLFWFFVRYEKLFPVGALIRAVFQEKYFKRNIDLSVIELRSNKAGNTGTSIDVIIPTLGRKQYILQVLEDLKAQTLLPKKVIIVEQDPDSGSQSELPELQTQSWPFEIVHHFTHKTGACQARNLALNEVDAAWVFFNDDDNRIEKDVLKNALQEINRIGADLLTLKYSQKGEKHIFGKIKQWGTLGAGNSIIAGKFTSKIRFDMAYEYGYAEDKDYGMQLRNAGCDIIYHPNLEILHLKAPRGGFRKIKATPWGKDKPKPSPTLMVYAKTYYSPQQLKGFKAELFLRYYSKQEVKNPLKYFKMMRQRWCKSEEWAERLMGNRKEKIESRAKNEESRFSL